MSEEKIRVWEPVNPAEFKFQHVSSVAGYYGPAAEKEGTPEHALTLAEDEENGAGWWVLYGDEKVKVHKVHPHEPIRVHSETAPPFGEWKEVVE